MSVDKDLERDKEIKGQFAFFLERGFTYQYLYEKGGDSACSYIYRFSKGRDFFDVRELSGGEELNFVVCVRGTYAFPYLKSKYKKEYRSFTFKHLFKKSTSAERRGLLATVLQKEYESEPDFFGISK
ncbi:MAG: hypothetical protein IJX18_03235 [Clostridia bacterium]|nr:hypothetical protein [Clostridia bacterium]MBQ8428248.1 hypothetical protein [Clostridia bacterium]